MVMISDPHKPTLEECQLGILKFSGRMGAEAAEATKAFQSDLRSRG